MIAKTPSESYTEQVHMVNAADLNGYKRLFGGTLMAWIDIVVYTARYLWVESFIICDSEHILYCSVYTTADVVAPQVAERVAECNVITLQERCILNEEVRHVVVSYSLEADAKMVLYEVGEEARLCIN